VLFDAGFFAAMPFRAGAYSQATPLMHEIRMYGVDL